MFQPQGNKLSNIGSNKLLGANQYKASPYLGANDIKKLKVNYQATGVRSFSSKHDSTRDSKQNNNYKNDISNYNVNSAYNNDNRKLSGNSNIGQSERLGKSNSGLNNNLSNRSGTGNPQSFRPYSSIVGKRNLYGQDSSAKYKNQNSYNIYSINKSNLLQSNNSKSGLNSTNNNKGITQNKEINDSAASLINKNDVSSASSQANIKRVLSPGINKVNVNSGNNLNIKSQNSYINQSNLSKGYSNVRSQTPNIIRKDGNSSKLGYGIGNLNKSNKHVGFSGKKTLGFSNAKLNSSKPLFKDKSDENLGVLNKSLDTTNKSKSIPPKNRNFQATGFMGVKGIGSSLVKSSAFNNSSASVNTTSALSGLNSQASNQANNNQDKKKGSYGFGNYHARNYSPNFNGYKMRVFGQNNSNSKQNLGYNNNANSKPNFDNSSNLNNNNQSGNNKLRSSSNNSNNTSFSKNNSKPTSNMQGKPKINIISNNSLGARNFNGPTKSFNFNNKSNNTATKNTGKVQLEFYDDQNSELKTNPPSSNSRQNKDKNVFNSGVNVNNNNKGNTSNNSPNPLSGINNSDVTNNNNNLSLNNKQSPQIISNQNSLIGNNNVNNNSNERSNKFISSNNNYEGKSSKEIIRETNDTSPFSHFHWKKIDNNKEPSDISDTFSPTKYVGKNNLSNFNGPKQTTSKGKNFVNVTSNRAPTPERIINSKSNQNNPNEKEQSKKNNLLNSRISVAEPNNINNNNNNNNNVQGNLQNNQNSINNQNIPVTYSKKTLGANTNLTSNDNKVKQTNTYSKANQNNVYQIINNQEEQDPTSNLNNNNKPSSNKITSLEQPSGSDFVDSLFNTPELKTLLHGNTGKNSQQDNKNIQSKITQINQSNTNNNSSQQSSNNLGSNNNNNNNNNNQNVSKNNEFTGKKIRVFKEYTKTGYTGTETKKNNQDIAIIYPNFNGNKDHYFFSVCDGHGIVGHDVSRYLKSALPVNLESDLKQKGLNVFTSDTKQVYKSVEDMFNLTNFNLNNSNVETEFSGSTCVSMFYSPTKIITANIGDSRIVMGKLQDGKWVSKELTRDHKPGDRDESIRIRMHGGRIEPYRDENNEFIGPERIWLKTQDIPGLAMSRSFGDRVAASVGCISTPEIFEFALGNEDKFLIVASDGVWEFISSTECVEIIKDYYLANDINGCCNYILKESSRRWIEEEEVIDDITMIVIFFD